MRKRSAFYLLGMLLVCAFVYSFTIKTIVGINVNWVFIIVTCILYIIVGAVQFPVGKGINLSLISFFMVVAIFSFGKFYTFVLIMPTTFIYKKLYFLLYQQKSGKRMENSTVDSLNTTIIRIIDIGF